MVNENRKKEFLSTLPVTDQVLMERIFSSIGPLEDKLGKDCSLFTMSEIDIFFKSEGATCKTNLAKKCNLLSRYTGWVQAQYPIKYATYGTYGTEHNLYRPAFNANSLNPVKAYTLEEFMDCINAIPSKWSRMLFMAMYNGLITSNDQLNFFYLDAYNLNEADKEVYTADGKTKPVSETMMKMLTWGSKQTTDCDTQRTRAVFNQILERDPTTCYKHLNVYPELGEDAGRLRVKNHIQNERKTIQWYIPNWAKFTFSNILMSGFLNSLIAAGITEGFNRTELYEENPVAQEIADRYDIPFRGQQKMNFYKRFEPYFTNTE